MRASFIFGERRMIRDTAPMFREALSKRGFTPDDFQLQQKSLADGLLEFRLTYRSEPSFTFGAREG